MFLPGGRWRLGPSIEDPTWKESHWPWFRFHCVCLLSYIRGLSWCVIFLLLFLCHLHERKEDRGRRRSQQDPRSFLFLNKVSGGKGELFRFISCSWKKKSWWVGRDVNMVQEQKRKKGFYFSDILSKKKNQTGILEGSCKTGGGGWGSHLRPRYFTFYLDLTFYCRTLFFSRTVIM